MKHGKMVILTAAVMVGLVGCGSGTAPSGPAQSGKVNPSNLHLDYANVTDNSTLFNAVQSGFIDGAHTIGAHLTTYDNNLSGTTALTNARLMVAEHPDLIFEYNVVGGLGRSLGETFTRAHVPCIAVNVAAPPCALENLNNPKLGADTGTVVAEKMKQLGWTGANTTVIIEQNATAGTDVNSSIRYFYAAVATAVPGMEKVAGDAIQATTTTIGSTGIQVDTAGTLDGAFNAVKNVLQGLPSDRHVVIYANNDDEALGGWRAVAQAGRSGNALAAGLGGSAPAMEQVRTNPQWVAEGVLFPQGWGEIGLAMAVAMLQGATPPETTYIPQAVITKSNLEQYFGSSNSTPRMLSGIPNDDKYLLSTGVLQKFHNIEGVQ